MTRVPLLPRNRTGTMYERIGLKIREFAAVSLPDRLDPFALAEFAKIRVIEPSEISKLPADVLDELTGRSQSSWSAVTLDISDGWQLCILNPTHGAERKRASLMEEIAHVILGHEFTRIVAGTDGLAFREYNQLNEQVAYGVGASALVPYAPLFVELLNRQTPETIAEHYGVSSQLVKYRIKITMLWPLYKKIERERRN